MNEWVMHKSFLVNQQPGPFILTVGLYWKLLGPHLSQRWGGKPAEHFDRNRRNIRKAFLLTLSPELYLHENRQNTRVWLKPTMALIPKSLMPQRHGLEALGTFGRPFCSCEYRNDITECNAWDQNSIRTHSECLVPNMDKDTAKKKFKMELKDKIIWAPKPLKSIYRGICIMKQCHKFPWLAPKWIDLVILLFHELL